MLLHAADLLKCPPCTTHCNVFSCIAPHPSAFLMMLSLQGFPTASLNPEDCRSRLEHPCFDLAGNPAWDAITPRLNQMPDGVYFGCGNSRVYM